MTLICFFLTDCFFMLVYGPVSDRFGRRRPLLVGVGFFIFASGMCALADDVYTLILDQVDRDVGAPSALAIFTFMTFGALSMGLISLAWMDKITVTSARWAASWGR